MKRLIWIAPLLVAIVGMVRVHLSYSEFTRNRHILDSVGAAVVFDSNLSGTFGIHSLASDSLTPKVVFDTNEHEIMPDPSPSGEWIVFARGRSPKRQSYFDIWVVRHDGSDARLVAKDGAAPTFDTSGGRIIFERNHRFVIAVDLHTGNETVLFDAKDSPIKTMSILLPRLSPDGQHIAFTTDFGRKYSVYIWSMGDRSMREIGHGCEPVWSADSKALYWVSDRLDAKHVTRVMRTELSSGSEEVVIDQPEPRGIDYFPAVTSDERYLLFAAAQSQRDYLKGDYQLFLLERATKRAVQLTANTSTNRWPKFLSRNHHHTSFGRTGHTREPAAE